MWEDYVGEGTGQGERGDVHQLAVVELVSERISLRSDADQDSGQISGSANRISW